MEYKKMKWWLIAYYDGCDGRCFDEDRYDFDKFEYAYQYCKDYNREYKKGRGFVRLFGFVDDKVGLILIIDENGNKK